MAQDRISFRADSELKKQADEIAKSLGTNTSAVLNMFLHAFVRKQGMPFDVSLSETYEERQRLNTILDERQAIIDEGNERNFNTHEDVKKMLGIESKKAKENLKSL